MRLCEVCGAPARGVHCEGCFGALVRCDTLGLRDGAIIGVIAAVIAAPFIGIAAFGVFFIVGVGGAGISASERERTFRAARKAQIALG